VKTRGILLVLISAVAFGCMPIFAHYAYREGADVPMLMFQRFAIATFLLLTIVMIRKERWPNRRSCVLLATMGMVYFLQAFAFFEALQYIPAGLTSLLAFLYPVLVSIASYFLFKDQLGTRMVGALILALIGMALSLGPIGQGSGFGVTLALLASVGMSIYMIIGRVAADESAPLASTAIVLASATVGALIFTMFHGGFDPETITELGWGFCLSMASVVGVGCMLMGIRLVGSTTTAILGIVEPITTAVLAHVILGQLLHGLQVLGGTLIVVAVVTLALSTRRKQEPLEFGL
jgi:drug/metabolite transporter (DMT)-like permease